MEQLPYYHRLTCISLSYLILLGNFYVLFFIKQKLNSAFKIAELHQNKYSFLWF